MEHQRSQDHGVNSNILVIDAMNMFIRNFQSSPAMTKYGDSIGGVAGFLRSLFHNIKMFNPSRCIIAMEGRDGAKWRRELLPEYKKGRRNKSKFNRIAGMKLDESTNAKNQIQRLGEYLNDLPVQILFLDGYEADDIVSFLVTDYFDEDSYNELVIVSSDKDFLQLTSDKVKVYRPMERKLYDCYDVSQEYRILKDNYLTLRAACGDTSDNIEGVRGLGQKNILKYFPEMEDQIVTISDIIDKAQMEIDDGSKYKAYKRVLLSSERLRLNERIMQLSECSIHHSGKSQIRRILDKDIYATDILEFQKKTAEDGISHLIHQSDIRRSLSKLDRYADKTI